MSPDVCHARDKIGGHAAKGDIAAIRRNLRCFRIAGRGRSHCADTGQCRGASLDVADKNVRDSVRVVGHEIAGGAHKCHMAGIGRHDRVIRRTIAHAAVGAGAYQGCRVVHQIPDKNVAGIIGVIGNQITRIAFKRGITAVGRDVHRQRIPVATVRSRQVDTDQCGRSIGPVAQEDIYFERKGGRSGNIVADERQIVGGAGKEHIATIGTDDWNCGVATTAIGRALRPANCRDQLKRYGRGHRQKLRCTRQRP